MLGGRIVCLGLSGGEHGATAALVTVPSASGLSACQHRVQGVLRSDRNPHLCICPLNAKFDAPRRASQSPHAPILPPARHRHPRPRLRCLPLPVPHSYLRQETQLSSHFLLFGSYILLTNTFPHNFDTHSRRRLRTADLGRYTSSPLFTRSLPTFVTSTFEVHLGVRPSSTTSHQATTRASHPQTRRARPARPISIPHPVHSFSPLTLSTSHSHIPPVSNVSPHPLA